MTSHLEFVFGIVPRRRVHHTNNKPQESFIALKSENILFFNRKYYNPLDKSYIFFLTIL